MPPAVTTCIRVVDKTRMEVTGTSPIRTDIPSVTVLPGSNPRPRISISDPPVCGPHFGVTDANSIGASMVSAPCNTSCSHTPNFSAQSVTSYWPASTIGGMSSKITAARSFCALLSRPITETSA